MLHLCLATAISATVANALLFHEQCLACIVPRLLTKIPLLEMPERAKLFAFACMLTLIVKVLASSISESFGRRISECLYFSRASRIHISLCISLAQADHHPPRLLAVIACILSECTWHRTITLCFSKCLATVASAIVFCKSIDSTNSQSIAVAATLFSLYSATSLDQKTTVGNAGAGKMVCIACMLTPIVNLFWQASSQSLLGGV